MATLKENLEAIKLEKDTKLIPENIKKGVRIFDIIGTAEMGGGTDTNDATATSNDIIAPSTAYVKGTKIYGTIQKTEEPIGEPTYNTNLNTIDAIPQNVMIAINEDDIFVSLNVPEKTLYFYKIEEDNSYNLLYTDVILFKDLDTGGQSQRLTISNCYFDGDNFDCILAYSPAQGDGKVNPISFARFSYTDGVYSCEQIENTGEFINDDTYHDNMVRFITDDTGTYLARIYGVTDEGYAKLHLCVYKIDHTYNSTVVITEVLNYVENVFSSNYPTGYVERIVQLNISSLSSYNKLICLSYTGKTSTSTSESSRIYKEMCILLSTDCSTVIKSIYDYITTSTTTQYRANRFCTMNGYDMYVRVSTPSSKKITLGITKIDPNTGEGMASSTVTKNISLTSSIDINRMNAYINKNLFVLCVSTSAGTNQHLFQLYNFDAENLSLELLKTSDVFAPADYFAESFNIHQAINNDRFIAVSSNGVYSIHYTDGGKKITQLEFANGDKLYNTDDADATADKVLLGEVVYNNTGKIVGTYEPSFVGTLTPEEYDICNNLAALALGETPLLDDPNIAVTLNVTENDTIRVENNTLVIEEVSE